MSEWHGDRRAGLGVWAAVGGGFLTIAVLAFALASTFVSPGERESPAVERAARAAAVGEGGDGRVDERAATSAARRVRGTVIDTDGQPVREGVLSFACLDDTAGTVTAIAETVVVGEDGVFDAPACSGLTCVRLAHPALVPSTPWTLEGAGASDEAASIELVARPLLTRSGTVRAPDGEHVAGARVRVLPPREDDPRAVPAFTTTSTATDEDGAFTLFRVEHPPCDPCEEAQERCDPDAGRIAPTWPEMVLFVQAEGWPASELSFEVDAEDALDVTLSAQGPPLLGTLVDPAGLTYARATVLARSEQRPWERASADVASDGSFALRTLRDGTYALRAVQDGVELAVREGVSTSDEVELVGGVSASGMTVTVRVRDAMGFPASDVRVSGGPFREARSDVTGMVRAEGVLPGPFRLRWGERLEHGRDVVIPERGSRGGPSASRGGDASVELDVELAE